MPGVGAVRWGVCLLAVGCVGLSAPRGGGSRKRVLIIGGTGRIGTAVATRLLQREDVEVRLAGRDRRRGEAAVAEVRGEVLRGDAASFEELDFRDEPKLRRSLRDVDAVVHVAGPFYGQEPSILRACAELEVPTYLDVSDPPEFLEAARAIPTPKTTALLCAGAFPGMSNVLAMEAAQKEEGRRGTVENLRFSYFTSGLGGSGNVNLEITNFGFADVVPRVGPPLTAGADLGVVTFPRPVGERQVWSWPFPEALTVGQALNISGVSVAGMGTAPDLWNVVLRVLVALVPRAWWRSPLFSKGMAKFSEPLVTLTDRFLPETHAMRIDLDFAGGGSNDVATVLQAHDSFRRCVGQSAAEFCLDLMAVPADRGVWLPEERYRDQPARDRVIPNLTSTPGTTFFEIRHSRRGATPT